MFEIQHFPEAPADIFNANNLYSFHHNIWSCSNCFTLICFLINNAQALPMRRLMVSSLNSILMEGNNWG